MESIVGIDLGTTNSEVAVIIDGQPRIIPIDGESIMPSCVGLDSRGELVVGREAKNQMLLRPDETILSIKRLMGADESVSLGGKAYSPEEISALILGKLRDAATAFLGAEVGAAVITVPAYFDDRQRKATRKAGELAGLEVRRIILTSRRLRPWPTRLKKMITRPSWFMTWAAEPLMFPWWWWRTGSSK